MYMKKALLILSGFVFLVSCSNNGGQTGVMQTDPPIFQTPLDTDTGRHINRSATDTAAGQHRVDITKRDSLYNQQQATPPQQPPANH
jgi:hypothetical protein